VFQRLLLDRATPERCVEAFYLQRTRFERIAERKLRRRQLTEDGNVEITGRDLREGSALAHQRSERGDTVLPGERLRDWVRRPHCSRQAALRREHHAFVGPSDDGLSRTLRCMVRAGL
jgi:hypothetical protein